MSAEKTLPGTAEMFRLGMRRLASGVSVIATVQDNVPHGLVATSVSSLSSDPPSLVVCVNSNASAHDPIVETGIFSVNVLPATDLHLSKRFSDPSQRDRRFAASDWTALNTGAPVLKSAMAAFDCRLADTVRYFSHSLFIGVIIATEIRGARVDPLIYLDGNYRQLAELEGSRW